VPLEECPTCGYALSIADHRCRHCVPGLLAGATAPLLDAKRLPWLITTVVTLAALGYLFFFR